MTKNLPNGWAWAELGAFARYVNGRAFKPSEWQSTGRPIIRIQNLNNPNAAFNYAVGDYGTTFQVKDGDLLIAWSASLGAYLWRGGDAWLNQHIFRADLYDGGSSKRFLHYAIKESLLELAGKTHGMGMVHLTKGVFEAQRVPCPPVSEQRRIADKLDTVLGRVDALNERLNRIAPLLKRFRQAILAAATSGRLTEDWRGNAEFVATERSLRELGEVAGGLTKNARRDALPLRKPYLRVANVHANELRLGEVLTIGLTEAEIEKTRLKVHDLLIVEGNGSIDQIGRVAIWHGEISDCCHQNHLIRWRSGQKILAQFALHWLLSPAGRAQIVAAASSTTGLHTLSVTKVGALTLPVPSLEEQTEIVRRVEILFAYADRLEARLKAAQTAADRLTPALLAKAFRGELVPQDPNDEPASELLRRLQEARAAQAPSKAKSARAPRKSNT